MNWGGERDVGGVGHCLGTLSTFFLELGRLGHWLLPIGICCWVYLCVTLTVAHGPWLWLIDNLIVGT